MGAGASADQPEGGAPTGAGPQPPPPHGRTAAPAPIQQPPTASAQQSQTPQASRKPPMPPSTGNAPAGNRGRNEDDDDAAEWQRERERLAQQLKEKRDQEAAANAAAAAAAKNAPPSQQPPAGGNANNPSSPTGADPNAPPPDGKKKKKLLNGTNIEYRYPSGSTYVGGFKDGKLHGFGKYQYHPSGDLYEGEWFADMKHGQGTYTYEGGDTFSGEWRAGKKHGKGSYNFATGDEYVGNWKDDKIHGYGVFTIARNGNRYEGNWEESYRHGQGKLISGTGDVYEGNWSKGKEDGLGVLTYANGNMYAGEWKAGQMDGKGILRENGQKCTVEHIAGYLIAKVPVEPDQAIDPDWGAANRLYLSVTKSGGKGHGGAEDASSGSPGARDGVSEAMLTKLKLEKDMWEKKYMDLISKKSGSGDNAEDVQIESINDPQRLKAIALTLREQRDGAKLRAEELEVRERALKSELQELNFVADGLRKEMAIKKGGGADTAELERLQRRVAELERELAARKGGSNTAGKADDPVELRVKLELAEGELKNLRATRDEVHKLREQNLDNMKTIQGLEFRNEELIKEMNMQRSRAANLQQQITEISSRGAKESQDELSALRAELQDSQAKLAASEERIKKIKKSQEMLEQRARRADDLEAEVMRLSKLKTGDAELNKNLDKKMDQLDSLRRQNAELQRQVEELQHDLQNGAAPAASGKKKKKNKGGDDDDLAPSQSGAALGSAAADPAVVEQLQSELKKEKKKHKKAAADRDALAQELFEEQVRHARVERTLQNLHGRINVVAKVRSAVQGEAADSSAVMVNQDDPSQMIVMDEGNPVAFQFDTCIGPEQGPRDVFDEIKNTIAEVPDGYHTAFVFVGPMGTGKSTLLQGLVPMMMEELYNQLAIRHNNSILVNVQVGCVELTSDGAYDCASGVEIMSLLHDPKFILTPIGVSYVSCSNAIDAAAKIKAICGKRSKANGRSHLWIQIRTEVTHKVHRTKFVGKLTLCDLCGPGALSNQEADIESGKFANRSFQAIGGVIDALQGNSQTVPYTDHVSTVLLSDVLGGNAFTTIVACLSPSDDQLHDSVQTLQLANKATNVFNRPLVQHYVDSDEMRLRETVMSTASEEQAQVTMSEVSTIR